MSWFRKRPRAHDARSSAKAGPPYNDEEFGMFIFADQSRDIPEAVDIIAVHGLNGHYYKTWTASTPDGEEVNWLKDLLPKQIPNARIMSFGYNSAVQFSKSSVDIFSFADQLLEDLFSRRQHQAELGRPIIFVCHSLGGILFKQALNRAFEKQRYRSLLLSVVGVVFFGTPHRGADLAGWSTMFSNIIRFGTLGTTTNSQLSKDLESKSRVLATISRPFVDRGKELEIYSFYETDKMDYLNCRVVEQDSAILSWPNETALPMNGDHRSICRFLGENESRYRAVWTNIQNMARKYVHAPSKKEKLEKDQLLFDLWTSDYEAHKGRNPFPIEGTCAWILRHKEYKRWVETPSSSFLWISAHPGCGKSVLTSYLVDHYKQADRETSQHNICYFFFKGDNKEQDNATHAMQAILHQLYKAQPRLAKYASEHLKIGGHSRDSLTTLWAIFARSVSDPDAKPTLCFIDALDECELVSRKLLMEFMSGSFCTQGEGFVGLSVKILITSRPDNSIKVPFNRTQNQAKRVEENTKATEPELRKKLSSDKPLQPLCMAIRLRGEDETESISRDIKLVVKAAIKELVLQGVPEELLADIQDELINRADRTFLWAALIIGLLQERTEAGASLRELREILQSRSIDAIYTGLLKARPNPTKARKMLHLMVAAIRPLTVDELSVALAVQPDHDTFALSQSPRRPSHRTFDDIKYDLVYPFENHVQALCGNFVRIIKGRVYFVHETAREFLLKPMTQTQNPTRRSPSEWEAMMSLFEMDLEEETPTSSERSIGRTDNKLASSMEYNDSSKQYIVEEDLTWQNTFSFSSSHALLLEICVTYLYCLATRSKSTPPEQPPSGNVGAFFHYAAQSWVTHFDKVCTRIPPNALPYYHTLCHPMFPGFQAWLTENEVDAQTLLSGAIGSAEEVQDYLLKYFDLEPDHERLSEYTADDPADVDYIKRTRRVALPDKHSIAIQALSSNPTVRRDHNFPTHVDQYGFVSLGLGQNHPEASKSQPGAEYLFHSHREVLPHVQNKS